ncbi:MAG: YgiQ family radical SAM protein [Bacteroidetes bacterium]|nr:MAG: YgiQ family radical SAM protein [Bacteroidota bacterium]
MQTQQTDYHISDWLPTTPKEARLRDWDELDVVLFSGDAYIDHPSFGAAVVGRIIEHEGFRIAIVPQPNWKDDLRDFKKFGQPRLFFAVTAGSMDSMINHYTANKRLRSNDAYTAGNKAGFRPDYPIIVYSQILKKLYPETPVVIGGIEASLRRFTHYDYWQDQLKPSILHESGADLLVYGMGEQPLAELLRLLDRGVPFENIRNIRQTAILANEKEVERVQKKDQFIELSSHRKCLDDRIAFAKNFKHIERESNMVKAKTLLQNIGNKTLIVWPPFPTMSEKEIDMSFDLQYTRQPHPRYRKRGPIPAYEMIKFSVNMHRGCFGGCSFCTISAHQGKFVASRSKTSILKEVDELTKHPDFRGYLSDLGGPSANMYKMKGMDLSICDICTRPSCIFPNICYNLNTNHKELIDIYNSVNEHPQIKKAFIGSGIRYDMLVDDSLSDEDQKTADKYIDILAKNHVSGRLKVAPEHTSDKVLKLMRKPKFDLFYKFEKKFLKASERANLNQQVIPYFISSHPGSTMEDMADLAIKTKKMGFQLEQVQDLTPTPMTVAAVIYYSGVHPYTLKKVYTPIDKNEKLNQRKFFFWYKKENQNWIRKALNDMGKPDWISQLLGK